MRRIVLIAGLALATGCARSTLPFTRAQLATVERAVGACTDASGKLLAPLKAHDRAGAENAAVTARNACSSARADIVGSVGIGGPLEACYFAVDRQEDMQQAELHALDGPTFDNQRQVATTLDEAIRQQRACATAVETANRPA